MAEAKKTVKEKPAVKKTAKKAAAKPAKADKVAKEEIKNGDIQEVDQAKVQANDQAAAEVATTKAGKHSAKAVAEAEEKRAKVERLAKSAAADSEGGKSEGPKKVQKPARSRLERRSKGYRKLAEQINKTKTYELKEAVELAIKTSPVKFDATAELHINLNVDPRQADQNVRGTVVLPAGTGKSLRVAVFGEADEVTAAKKAGADIAAGDEFLQQLDKGQLDFDILVASPKVMAKLGKYAKLLGPKGLMPNPKSGTVTTDVAKAVKDAKAGRVEYRVDSTGIIHTGFGKVSFGQDKLVQNAEAVLGAIRAAKPASIKGTYVKSAFVSTTMGPSIRLGL